MSTDLLSFKHPSVLLFCSNSYTFVCKRYYVSILIDELGLNSPSGNHTYMYNLTSFSASEVLDNYKSVLTSVGIDANDEELDMPYIYWILKMHNIPINIDKLPVQLSTPLSFYPFFLIKVFRRTAKQPILEIG